MAGSRNSRQEERIGLERALGERADPLGEARQRLDRLQRKGAAPRLRPRLCDRSEARSSLEDHLHLALL